MRDLLRGEWGFKGLVVSDYFGVSQLQSRHHVVADLPGAARKAIESGVDMELPEPEGFASLAGDVTAGRVPLASIDQAVARVLRAKFQVGLFEHPYVAAPPPPELDSDRALALRAAEEAIVLLKNDGGLLPLLDAARLKSIASDRAQRGRVPARGLQRRLRRARRQRRPGHRRARGANASRCDRRSAGGLTRGNRGWTDDTVELSPIPRTTTMRSPTR